MYEDLCFEDTKRQYLQQLLIPEDVRRHAEKVLAFFEQDLISKGQAVKYLEEIGKEPDKLAIRERSMLH